MHDDATPKRTFEEIEANLAAIMGMTKKTPEEQDAHHLRCDASTTARSALFAVRTLKPCGGTGLRSATITTAAAITGSRLFVRTARANRRGAGDMTDGATQSPASVAAGRSTTG